MYVMLAATTGNKEEKTDSRLSTVLNSDLIFNKTAHSFSYLIFLKIASQVILKGQLQDVRCNCGRMKSVHTLHTLFTHPNMARSRSSQSFDYDLHKRCIIYPLLTKM